MAKAIWNGVVIAESNNCEVVEGNQYFPQTPLKKNTSEIATPTPPVAGRGSLVTIPWRWEAKLTKMLLGIILAHYPLPRRSKVISPSGEA
ncbi:Nucleotidyltransferase [Limnospira platensis C1]|nr:Nucleotidyltransferase [Arthrospira platensis C1]